MGHDASTVLMGSTRSNIKEVVPHPGDIAAGIVVRRKSDGTLSTTSSDGAFYGVSLGKDLSNAGYSAICVKGVGVPVQLKDSYNPAIGAVMEVDNSTGLATGDGSKTATAAVFAAPGDQTTTARVGGNNEKKGVAESGSNVGVAYIDFPGGL